MTILLISCLALNVLLAGVAAWVFWVFVLGWKENFAIYRSKNDALFDAHYQRQIDESMERGRQMARDAISKWEKWNAIPSGMLTGTTSTRCSATEEVEALLELEKRRLADDISKWEKENGRPIGGMSS